MGIRIAAVMAASLIGLVVASPASASRDSSYGGVKFRVELSGEQEVPPADENGRGIAKIRVNADHDRLCYSLAVRHIDGDITAAHIHLGEAGVNGPVVVVLETPSDGPVADCVSIDPALAEAIADDPEDYYVNVHSTVFPDGAVRGQLA